MVKPSTYPLTNLLMLQMRYRLYTDGIHTIVITGQFPVLHNMCGIIHVLDIFPATRCVRWSSGALYPTIVPGRYKRDVIITLDYPNLYHGVNGPGFSINDGTLSSYALQLGTTAHTETQRLRLVVKRPYVLVLGDLHEDDIDPASDMLFRDAEGVFGLPYDSLEILTDAYYGRCDIQELGVHLGQRERRALPQYRSIRLTLPGIMNGGQQPLVLLCETLAKFNGELKHLALDIGQEASQSMPTLGQALLETAWHRLKKLQSLSLRLKLHDVVEHLTPKWRSIRKECGARLWDCLPTVAHDYESTPLPQRCASLRSLHIDLDGANNYEPQTCVLEFSFLAERIVALGGPGCTYWLRRCRRRHGGGAKNSLRLQSSPPQR